MKDFNTQSVLESNKKRDKPIVFVSSAFREQYLAQLKGSPLSIYLAYRSYANKEGIAWPSLQCLARATGCGIIAVKRGKQMLIEIGLLVPIEQNREGGQFGRKKFRVNTVAPKQDHGTVAPSTVAPSTAAPKQCQEGFPIEGDPIEGDPIKAPPTPLRGKCDGFSLFWFVYPRKAAKQKAARAWSKIKPKEIRVILASVEAWKNTEQWHREGGRFIPHPATFLNDRRWEEEVPGPGPQPLVLHADGKGKFDDIPVL